MKKEIEHILRVGPIGERLIAYKYGKTSEVQVQNIEKSLNTIIEQFEEMKKDLVFLLSENENQQN